MKAQDAVMGGLRTASLACVFLIVLAVPGLAEKIRYVIDGDTLVLENEIHVRLIGIDAPEIDHPAYGRAGEPFGNEAADYLRELLAAHEIRLESGAEPKDRYGRTLAFVYRDDGLFVNRTMVEKGYAEAYRRFDFPQKSEFVELEKKARAARIGMWAARQDDWKEQFLHWFSQRGPHRKAVPAAAEK